MVWQGSVTAPQPPLAHRRSAARPGLTLGRGPGCQRLASRADGSELAQGRQPPPRHPRATTAILAAGLALALGACVSPRQPSARRAVLHPESAADLRQLVSQSRAPVLIVFTSASCASCRGAAATLESLAADYGEKLVVVEADLAKTGAVIDEYRLVKVPTVVLLRQGQELARRHGVLPAFLMRPYLDDALGRPAQ